MPKPSINEINMALGIANLLAGQLANRLGLPIPALITSKLNFATQTGVTTVSISEGTGTTNIPYTDVQISGPVLAEFAKIGGIIAATAAAAGVTLGAAGLVPIGLTVLAGLTAAKANETISKTLSDPNFRDAILNGGVENYLQQNFGITVNDLYHALLDGTLNGEISELKARINPSIVSTWTKQIIMVPGDDDGDPGIKGVSFAFNFSKPCHVAHALN